MMERFEGSCQNTHCSENLRFKILTKYSSNLAPKENIVQNTGGQGQAGTSYYHCLHVGMTKCRQAKIDTRHKRSCMDGFWANARSQCVKPKILLYEKSTVKLHACELCLNTIEAIVIEVFRRNLAAELRAFYPREWFPYMLTVGLATLEMEPEYNAWLACSQRASLTNKTNMIK